MSIHDSLCCLKNPPKDNITNIVYHPTAPNLLLSSSWDQTIRLHDTLTCELKLNIEHDTSLLDTCFGNGEQVFSAGIDGQLSSIDLVSQRLESIGRHVDGVSSLCWSTATSLLYSGSWDKSIGAWDTRTQHHSTHLISHKVYSMDLQDCTLAVALSNEQVHLYDTRKMDTPWNVWDTKVHGMLKTVRLMPNHQGVACSSMKGSVSMNHFGNQQAFVFKSHRQILGNSIMVYPVNALSFHPKYGTLATGGSDGVVNIWDGIHRKRIMQLPKYPEEVSNVAFNHDGSQLAIAYSYTYDEGERSKTPEAIYIKHMDDTDCKPCSNTTRFDS
ncbi:WD40-repeat-containing domain protein [Chlamydoabsidia padenii]|nr:WD40-repeat-containing domain protein [Chlamydoabsidia padenii]